ncbi:hypothetical protein RRF57_004078 [Xylaria bambusicola]|uniref:Myb-like domain-containing protein n=1 Tax=Xylaria bambusicola TaxID=326684 RepID=A0AAN7UG21_9PEZI
MDIDSDEEIITSPINYRPSAPSRRNSPLVNEKRQAEDFIARGGLPSLKRRKGDFNAAYLSLLNQDIQDAASGLIKSEDYDYDYDSESAPTQIGAVVWSDAEKNAFFAAVSRLDRDDVARIAARIGTKSEIEVRQYLVFLDAAKRHPRGREGKAGAPPQLTSLRPVDVPAAVEIGAECAASLEAAADALALRQEAYEEEVERERWGARWLITGPLATILEMTLRRHNQRQGQDEQVQDSEAATARREKWKNRPRIKKKSRIMKEEEEEDEEEGEEQEQERSLEEMPFLQLFHVENWLQLSGRLFMNSTIADGNWRAVAEEDELPAIRATALADLHALALSITRRLIFAAAYIAESRTRTRSLDDARRHPRPRVRDEDVRAAVSSLGMRHDSREFWARCARRLQLNVVDDGIEDDDDYYQEIEGDDNEGGEEDMDVDERMSTAESSDENPDDADQEEGESEEDEDYDIMSYDAVEAALGFQTVGTNSGINSRPGSPETDDIFPSPGDSSNSSSYEESDAREYEDEDDKDYIQEVKEAEDNDGLNVESINRDIEEAMSSIGFQHSTAAVTSRIRAEHRLERDAEHLDLKASAMLRHSCGLYFATKPT